MTAGCVVQSLDVPSRRRGFLDGATECGRDVVEGERCGRKWFRSCRWPGPVDQQLCVTTPGVRVGRSRDVGDFSDHETEEAHLRAGESRPKLAGRDCSGDGPEAPENIRDSYPALDEQALRRIEQWLSVLVQQGSMASGDNVARARFLLTVVNGLALGRALPVGKSGLEREVQTLTLALDALPFLSLG